MLHVPDNQGMQSDTGYRRCLSILLWIAVSTGWAVSVFSVIEEMCMVSACRDTASFTFFRINIGWLGIAYFSLILISLWLRRSSKQWDWAVTALVFSGIGAEFRLLWIQKYIIGSWCPLCVTICCSLFVAAMLLLIEKRSGTVVFQLAGKRLAGWVAFVVSMIATGLVVSIVGVQALT